MATLKRKRKNIVVLLDVDGVAINPISYKDGIEKSGVKGSVWKFILKGMDEKGLKPFGWREATSLAMKGLINFGRVEKANSLISNLLKTGGKNLPHSWLEFGLLMERLAYTSFFSYPLEFYSAVYALMEGIVWRDIISIVAKIPYNFNGPMKVMGKLKEERNLERGKIFLWSYAPQVAKFEPEYNLGEIVKGIDWLSLEDSFFIEFNGRWREEGDKELYETSGTIDYRYNKSRAFLEKYGRLLDEYTTLVVFDSYIMHISELLEELENYEKVKLLVYLTREMEKDKLGRVKARFEVLEGDVERVNERLRRLKH